MKYAMLIYQTPEAFEARKNGDDDPSVGAWRAYYKAPSIPVPTSAATRCTCPRRRRPSG